MTTPRIQPAGTYFDSPAAKKQATVIHESAAEVRIVVRSRDDLNHQEARYEALYDESDASQLTRHPAWVGVLQRSLRHEPYCIEATLDGRLCALLPLVLVRSRLFGSFLVSLPYLNTGGVLAVPTSSAESHSVRQFLIDRAVQLAEELDVRYLELRNETPIEHDGLSESVSDKVHMRLALPNTADELWASLSAKVRNQIRKAQKLDLTASWGGVECVADFYAIFSQNMRDLGTPVYPRSLFREIVLRFPNAAEFCVVRAGDKTLAAGLLLHGPGMSEVPSASSLRRYNSTNANMLLYWHLLARSVERRQQQFDFGRSSPDSGTYRFKRQWGAHPTPATWQYRTRRGTVNDMRPGNTKYRHFIKLWQRMPVSVTNCIGPIIVRGIP